MCRRPKRYAGCVDSDGAVPVEGERLSGIDRVRKKGSGTTQPFRVFLLVIILLTANTATSWLAAAVAAAVVVEGEVRLSDREDHAVIAVTVDGHVHTLDAWTGDVRGVFLDSGGPLVSSSTTVDVPGDEASDGDSDGDADGRPRDRQKQHPPRNALREGFVVPGLDGVIYLLGADGRLSVLMSSAPDLVLEPRMACLTINADADGVVEDEGCGLLIGEKTTQLFSLNTRTGEAKLFGGGGDSEHDRQANDEGIGSDGGGKGEGERDWGNNPRRGKEWTQDRGPQGWRDDELKPHQQHHQNKLLLQRDEYVVRAFDASTSEEIWFVTVAHFSALDLEGRGGPTALTHAKIAATDRAGYGDGLVKTLPPPMEEEDYISEWGGDSWGSIEPEIELNSGKSLEEGDGVPASFWEGRGSGSAGGDAVSGGGQARRRDRFGPAHADRFPYLLYENNAHVVAMDPLDGTVLWRKEMPTLAVSLYGIRGREWVDILPPPMSMLQQSSLYEQAPGSAPAFAPHAPFNDGEGLDGKVVEWSPSYAGQLLLLTGGGEAEGVVKGEDGGSVSWNPPTDEVSAASELNKEDKCRSGDDRYSDGAWDSAGIVDGTAHPFTSILPAVGRRPGAGRIAGLLPQGSRQGPLHAQVGFLNGHFFVSSSLRRVPLHAVAVDDSTTLIRMDRYSHSPGVTSRGTVVNAGAKDLLGVATGDSGGTSDAMGGTSPLPLPVVKMAPHAARPANLGRGKRVADRGGNRVKLGSEKIGDASGGFLSGSGAEYGGGLGTEIGLGGWRQALLERVEREMERRKGTVEVHPEKEGLYMSWNFVAAVVGLVSVTVIGVALTAYKHGAKAMLNVSVIARNRGALSRRNTAVVVVAPVTPNRRRSEEPRDGPDRLSPPLPTDTPSLNHGVSMSSAVSGARAWAIASSGGHPRGPDLPPDSTTFQEVRTQQAIPIHRVHSLPALRQQTLSPPTHPGRQLRVVGWPILFHSDENKGGLAGAPSDRLGGGGGSVTGGLVRAVTEGVDRKGPDRPHIKAVEGGSRDSSLPQDGGERLPGDVSNPSTTDARNPAGESDSGTSSSSSSSSRKNRGLLSAESFPGALAKALNRSVSSTSSAYSAELTLISSCEDDWSPRKVRGESRSFDAGVVTAATAAASAAAYSAAGSGSSDGRRRQRSRLLEVGMRSCRNISVEDDGSVEIAAGGGRRASGEREALRNAKGKQWRYRSDISPRASKAESKPDGGRRASNSPRASLEYRDGLGGSNSQWASGGDWTRNVGGASGSSRGSLRSSGEEMVLGAVGCDGGVHRAVSTGGDAEALLVTNRRLRTEFVEGQKLGRGGFGTVFKCRNRLDGHDYAIKKIRLSSDPRWQSQLAKVLREVKIMSLLDHPNIVRYYQAWLEKFTEEDEELQRGQAAPSSTAASESWDPDTAGSRSSHNRNTGTGATAAVNRKLTSAYQSDLYRAGDGRGGYIGAYASRSLWGRGGGSALRRSSDGSARPLGCGRDSRAWRSPGDRAGPSNVLYEEQSVDEWSLDSRHVVGEHFGRIDGGGGGAWGNAQVWDEADFSREDDDDEGLEEDDDSSLPGFVFDRGGADEDIVRLEDDADLEVDIRGAGADLSQSGSVPGKFEGGGLPSGSVGGAAAAVRCDTVDDCSESGPNVNTSCTPRPVPGSVEKGARDNGQGNGVGRGEESPTGCDHALPGHEKESRCDSHDDLGDSKTDAVDGLPRRDIMTNAPPSLTFPATNGHHPAGGRGVEPDDPPAQSGTAKQLLADRREKLGHVSDDDGAKAVTGARNLHDTQRERRPRGKSWPQKSGLVATVAAAAVNNDDLRVLWSQNGFLEERSRGTPGRARASATAQPTPAASRRREFRRGGAWERGRDRVRGRPRRGSSREVYDLWLYIQMQYCSHNNLQHFLEENPDRRSQTRVDMPQVMHIFLQIVKGLQYVHACGLIHRDLKPANCFLMGEGTVKIGDFGLSRHILAADGINGINGSVADVTTVINAPAEERKQGSFTWEPDRLMGDWGGGDGGDCYDDASITGGVGTYLYASPEQMSGKGYDEKTDVYSLGMLLFEMCHPPFDTKMERTVVLTNAHRLVFPEGDAWGPPKGQEAMKILCSSMLQRDSAARPSASDIVRQVEMMQGKHMLLQLDKKPPGSYGAGDGGSPGVAVVLRVEAMEQEGLLHRLVDRIRALCKGQAGHDATAAGGRSGEPLTGQGGGARLEQYGLRGHTGSAVMEFLVAGAGRKEREAIVEALESLPEVKTVREFPANG